MRLYTIDTGYFKLDGGAMFGVVPKSIWNKLNPADENNMCTWAMRCLLVQTPDRLILIDTGIGNKQSVDFFKHFYLHGIDTLENSLNKVGFALDQITDVILTHLHFDHVGGAVSQKDGSYKLTFPKAKYWVHSAQLDWALHPNAREKASFLAENIHPLIEAQQLHLLDRESAETSFEPHMKFLYVDGHTEKQVLPLIAYGPHTILYAADLIPSVGHIPIPYVMSYDMRPLHTLQEKKEILEKAYAENWLLFFEHDPLYELCSLQKTDKGIRAKDFIKIAEL